MHILIIEDEQLSAKRLCRLLKEIDSMVQIPHPVATVEDAIEEIRNYDFDMIFSDIRLSDGTCFDAFAKANPKCPIIFTTAYDDYAFEAFKYNVADYITKPIDKVHLAAAFEKAKKLCDDYALSDEKGSGSYRSRFLITKGGYSMIPKMADDVTYILTECGCIKAFFNDGSVEILSIPLSKLEKELNPDKFIRANRQYIVNIDYIEKIDTGQNYSLTIRSAGNHFLEIPISRERVSALKEKLDW